MNWLFKFTLLLLLNGFQSQSYAEEKHEFGFFYGSLMSGVEYGFKGYRIAAGVSRFGVAFDKKFGFHFDQQNSTSKYYLYVGAQYLHQANLGARGGIGIDLAINPHNKFYFELGSSVFLVQNDVKTMAPLDARMGFKLFF